MRIVIAVQEKCFNIGGGLENSMSLLELFDRLANLLGLPQGLAYEKLPRRQSDQDYFVADISKAKRILDWAPQVGATQGLQQMIEWINAIYDTSSRPN